MDAARPRPPELDASPEAWSPADWARLMAFYAGQLDLARALRVIAAAPAEIADALSDTLRDASPLLLAPANEG